MGLRNPYTFAFEPGTGRMFINDVGEGLGRDRRGEAAANYGWAGSTHRCGRLRDSPPWANYHDPDNGLRSQR